jgi:hypothetical protein
MRKCKDVRHEPTFQDASAFRLTLPQYQNCDSNAWTELAAIRLISGVRSRGRPEATQPSTSTNLLGLAREIAKTSLRKAEHDARTTERGIGGRALEAICFFQGDFIGHMRIWMRSWAVAIPWGAVTK